MSAFDPIEKQVQELDEAINHRLKEEELFGYFLRCGVQCIEVEDVNAFGDKVEEFLSPSYAALDDFFQSQKGRPVYRWDIRDFRKDDAIGSLFALSKMPKSPKPVVVIEDITEIPVGAPTIYDDPKRVEELMLHNWKNEHSLLDDPKFGKFEIRPADYSVLITWSERTAEKMKQLWRPSDGFALIKHY